ncbi:uncharacterized protein LOC110185901 [Drosophila serrata]|uniref:uncharacterized protein LOC110185901 n=1 Tax=Drosophila serrata TaxID=7274 RepID=UPI000A1D363D|nr:uncharacterized protein LOC110185901 [Drosophila serrata]
MQYMIFQVVSKVQLTNLNCTSLDPKFSNFEYCHFKAVNRSFKYISIKVKLYKTPITNVQVNFALLKRFGGYKPFLYNVNVDACKFLRNPSSNPVVVYLYSFFKSHSNMNHTCPYNHDLIVDKLTVDFLNTQVTEVITFPLGEFLFQSQWFAYNILRATVNIYVTIS